MLRERDLRTMLAKAIRTHEAELARTIVAAVPQAAARRASRAQTGAQPPIVMSRTGRLGGGNGSLTELSGSISLSPSGRDGLWVWVSSAACGQSARAPPRELRQDRS